MVVDTVEKIEVLEKVKKSRIKAKKAESESQQIMIVAITTDIQYLTQQMKGIL